MKVITEKADLTHKTSDLLPKVGQQVYFYNTVTCRVERGTYGVGADVDEEAMWQCWSGGIYNKYVTDWAPAN